MVPSFLSSPVQDWPASKLSRSTRDSAERERVRLTSPTSPQTLKNRGKEDLDASKEKRFHYKNCYSTSLSYRQNIKSFAILSSTRFGILSLINYRFKFHIQKPMQINYAVSSCR